MSRAPPNEMIRMPSNVDRTELFSTAVPQSFAFPKTVLRIVYDNLSTNPNLIRKLQMCCKYFLHSFDILVLNGLLVSHNNQQNVPHISYMKYFLFISPNHPVLERLDNIGLRGTLRITDAERRLTQQILPKITVFQAMRIQLYNQILTVKEAEVMAESKHLKEIDFSSVEIRQPDGVLLSLHRFLKLFAYVESLKLSPARKTDNTNFHLSLMERKKKFKLFDVDFAASNTNPEGFMTFLKNNMAPRGKIVLNRGHYYARIVELLRKWDPEEDKPIVSWSDSGASYYPEIEII